ncbi:MAG: prolyl oligopeptidase family serine peptidase [Brumimicrobium sp.]|nr:prolyl oligopeptidase family serine peptidase [Brumimicrobium sp.]
MRYILIFINSLLLTFPFSAQLDVSYKKPPREILELVDIDPTPFLYMDSKGDRGVFISRDAFKSLEDLAQDEVRLGGLRIDPATNGRSRQTYYKDIAVQNLRTGEKIQAKNLPDNPRLSDFRWSPSQAYFTFTNTNSEGISLWYMDAKTAVCKQLTPYNLNGVFGAPYDWCPDNASLLVFTVPENRIKIDENSIPKGPIVQETSGSKAPVRTYQDLLSSKKDEALFEYYANSEVFKVDLEGNLKPFLPKAIYYSVNYSPNGKLILVNTIEKPFSYIVPYYRFPENFAIHDELGVKQQDFYKKPLIEELPKGFDAVQTGKRYIYWRADQDATLYWAEAQDGGEPENEVPFRDYVYQQDLTKKSKPVLLVPVKYRFRGIMWGNNELAILNEGYWKTRRTGMYLFNPSKKPMERTEIVERSSQDLYSDPGSFETELTGSGRYQTLKFSKDGKSLYLTGQGYSPEGNKPFLDKFNIKTRKTERLWQAAGDSTYEQIMRITNWEDLTLITRIESKNTFPNYFFRHVGTGTLDKITDFKNPYESFNKVHKEEIEYKRQDGVNLTGTLYLPPGYDPDKEGRLPVFIWAYPREYKDASEAGQIKDSPHKFTRLFYGSPVYWAVRGYAVLDDASFPIIGEGDEEPNDRFIEQLVANGKAAIDALTERKIADPERVAIGGHSYGAFMTANLLAHSDLFAAGIARSGAYNRTLTPFGFQSEERTFWDNPELYMRMSPFTNADQINEPLLLIHGNADNNPGTFTLQSERLYGAIKGLGGISRLVLLPYESHGYAAKENILHMLWEMDEWLETHVKNKEKL